MGPSRRIRQGLPIWLLLSATAMLLVGCGGFMDVTVEFAANEQWEADVVYTLPADLVALTGPQEVEAALEDEAESFEAKGARMTWKSSESDGDLIYSVKVTGTGLDRLAETVFYGDARIYLEERDGRRVIHFSHSESLGMGAVWELTLKGGEILSGNGPTDRQTDHDLAEPLWPHRSDLDRIQLFQRRPAAGHRRRRPCHRRRGLWRNKARAAQTGSILESLSGLWLLGPLRGPFLPRLWNRETVESPS